jgi:hypothetical protein
MEKDRMTLSYTACKSSLDYYKKIVKNNKDIIYTDGSSFLDTAKRKVEELTKQFEEIKKAEGRNK